MATSEKPTWSEKEQSWSGTDSNVQIEDAGRRLSTAEEVTELSGIEATAASKAAWLISITVSMGGAYTDLTLPEL